jgi:hypothetical protein
LRPKLQKGRGPGAPRTEHPPHPPRNGAGALRGHAL